LTLSQREIFKKIVRDFRGVPRGFLLDSRVAGDKIERRARIRASVTKQLNANPELKEAYRKLVKNLPAEQQEKAMATIAARTLRTIMPRKQTTGARV